MPPRLTQPFEAIQEAGLTELVGADEEVNTNDYGASVAITLPALCSGEILHFTFTSKETGSGAVPAPAGILYIFDANPAIAVGDTAITAAERETLIAQILVSADDWKTDANGGSATIFDNPVAFHNLSTLYLAWFHEDSTDINDAAGDDESLSVNFWYRRDS
jgi:hypothetical protein